jgi:hypothetical protein
MALLDTLLRDDPQKRSGRTQPPGNGIPAAPPEELTTGFEETALSTQSGGGPPDDGPRARRRRLLQERRNLMTDTSNFEAPQRDQEARRLQRTIAGVGALSSLVAAFAGDPVAAAPGAGLAQGAQQNVRSLERDFQRRRQAFRKTLRQAREQNRELRLSINEAKVRGAEREADRQFEREQAEADRRSQSLAREDRQKQKRDLVRLRERLDRKLSPQQKQKVGKELELLDARIQSERAQGEAFEALQEKRRADAERSGRGGGGGEENPYRNLSSGQLQDLIRQNETLVQTGFPSHLDTDQSGTINQSERDLAALPGGPDIPNPSDVNEAAEQLSLARQEAMRRGLIDEQDLPRNRTENRHTFLDEPPPDSTGAPRQDRTRGDSTSRDTSSAAGQPRTDTEPGYPEEAEQGGGSTRQDRTRRDTSDVVSRLNTTLQQRGRAAALDTLLQMRKSGEVTPAQAQQLATQIVPDSLRQRIFQSQ